MRSICTYTTALSLSWALAVSPAVAQPIGGGTQPPTKIPSEVEIGRYTPTAKASDGMPLS